MGATIWLMSALMWPSVQDAPGRPADDKPPADRPADVKPADVKLSVIRVVETRKLDLEKKDEDGFMSFSFDRPGTKLTLLVKGPTAASATHWGMLKLEGADDKGRPVKPAQDQPSFNNPADEYVRIDRDQMTFGAAESPADELRLEVGLAPVERDARTLSLRGQFRLKVAELRDVVAVERDADGTIRNEVLRSAGLTVRIRPPQKSDDSAGFVFEVTGPFERVLDAVVVNAEGEPLESSGSQRMSDGQTAEFTIWFGAAQLPDDARLKLTVAINETEFGVPVELKDIRLP